MTSVNISAIVSELLSLDKHYINILSTISKLTTWTIKDVDWAGIHMNTLVDKGIITFDRTTGTFMFADGIDPKLIADEVKKTLEVMSIDETAHETIERERTKTTILDEELIHKFERLLDSGTDMLSYLAEMLNPKIEGMINVKKALVLSIASDGDKFGDRGRLHVLMYGDPGSAKSQLMSWIVYQLGAHFCSQRTSKVGLTADASGNDLTPGALPRAHRGILCIDELDKYSSADRQGMLEALEEGKIHIEVGKVSATLDAEVRVIAAANRIKDFSEELLDRFDFKFELKAPVEEMQKRVTCSIVKNWFKEKHGYYGIELKNYLAWIKSYEPDILPDVRNKIERLICMYLDLDDSLKGSPRRTESLMRVIYTIAKIHRRNVKAEDAIIAMKILNPNLNGGKLQALESLLKALTTEKL